MYNNMPKRVVFTKTIKEDSTIISPIQAGTINYMTERQFNWFKEKYPDCISEIEMTYEDWIDLTTQNFQESYNKLTLLNAVRDFYNLEISVNPATKFLEESVPPIGQKVNPSYYGGGLFDVYNKSVLYKTYVNTYEKEILENIQGMENGNNINLRIIK